MSQLLHYLRLASRRHPCALVPPRGIRGGDVDWRSDLGCRQCLLNGLSHQQALEVSEEKSLEREDILQKQIKELLAKLKLADTRSENSEMDIGRLNVRIDKVEEDLVTEKSKIKQVSDDLNAVFEALM